MSHELEENVVFQFTVVDTGHFLCSSYDMVLNGLSGEGDDIALEDTPKPCIGVRVTDYKHSVVHLWSLEKLHRSGQADAPDVPISGPAGILAASESRQPVRGDVYAAVHAGWRGGRSPEGCFRGRVQDFSSTSCLPTPPHAIGIIKLALEPSTARAPSNTIKFNVVMHEMVGFAEREGTEVHAQLFLQASPKTVALPLPR